MKVRESLPGIIGELKKNPVLQKEEFEPGLMAQLWAQGGGTGILSLEAHSLLGAGGDLRLLCIFNVSTENRFAGASFLLDEGLA